MSPPDSSRFPSLTLALPGWVGSAVPSSDHVYATVEERMEFVIRLAQSNIERRTGGPFGAAAFDLETGTLLAPGVNLVVPTHCSAAHAEILALSISQQILETHDLGGPGLPPIELVTSAEPCSMCLGAVVWSGVRSLVCGARDEDARAVGFDEGPKPAEWEHALQQRGVRVRRDVKRDAAVAILQRYVAEGGRIYNGGTDSGNGRCD